MKLQNSFLKKLFRSSFLVLSGVYFVFTRLEKNNHQSIRWGKIFKFFFFSFLIFSFCISGFVLNGYDKKMAQKIDGCAVVFGAAVWKNDIPSHALNDRIQAAIKLYKNDQVNCLIMTGGESTYGSHEVDVMEKVAIEAGIPKSRITKDYNGNNTLLSIINLPKDKPLVLVSNDFHLSRIGLLAYQKNISEFHLHKADYLNGMYGNSVYYFFREVFGVSMFSTLGWFQ